MACPYFAKAIVTIPSGNALPMAMTVIPKYDVERLVSIPKNVSKSIKMLLMKYVQINEAKVT